MFSIVNECATIMKTSKRRISYLKSEQLCGMRKLYEEKKEQ